MSIKNAIGYCVYSFAASALCVIGWCAGITVWNNGLGDLVEEKTKTVFNRHEEV